MDRSARLLPSVSTFDGYFHFESAEVPGLARHLVHQNVHCARDLFITVPSPGPVTLDAGEAVGTSWGATTGADEPYQLEGCCPGTGFGFGRLPPGAIPKRTPAPVQRIGSVSPALIHWSSTI
jgi:hypothetical protein